MAAESRTTSGWTPPKKVGDLIHNAICDCSCCTDSCQPHVRAKIIHTPRCIHHLQQIYYSSLHDCWFVIYHIQTKGPGFIPDQIDMPLQAWNVMANILVAEKDQRKPL